MGQQCGDVVTDQFVLKLFWCSSGGSSTHTHVSRPIDPDTYRDHHHSSSSRRTRTCSRWTSPASRRSSRRLARARTPDPSGSKGGGARSEGLGECPAAFHPPQPPPQNSHPGFKAQATKPSHHVWSVCLSSCRLCNQLDVGRARVRRSKYQFFDNIYKLSAGVCD